ncbi:RNA polymerase sigma-70 factor, ECF subfamily [Mucilaginibacter sp. OK268]|uniref:RNA polymerase sigma factor n=1 Tax=Mucilaginibacter sp. OK268 TaxID=1881048 RepID=UPI00088A66A5|nr:RNA polymerase sigma-70 factor [Mucilaginibacter sp. OK268]SDP76486.1 RNA polymerase sigma-70 factor, ECF subfamily [Mucilaginibacter sp. OK268]
MPDSLSEIELVKLVSTGNERAFRKLYITYHQLLRTHVFRLTESSELADEIVQDVFLKIWNSRETLDGINNFKGYLFILSRNYTIDFLRKHIRQTILHQQWESEEVQTFKEEGLDGNTHNYYGLLDEAIDQLPPQQKKVYLLSRHEHLKYVEIAGQLGISRETVKTYLQLATASITLYVKKKINFIVLLLFLIKK